MANNKYSLDYDVFISYRRDGGEFVGKVIYDKLTAKGYKCFFDVETMRSGKFNEQLYDVLHTCKDVLVVLSPGALDRCVNEGDWVRNEIAHAMNENKNIVPIMLRSFEWPESLPEDISELPNYEGVNASSEYFDASIDKIINLLDSESTLPVKPAKEKSAFKIDKKLIGLGAAVLAAIIAVIVVLFVVLGGGDDPQSENKPSSSTVVSVEDEVVTMSDKLEDFTFTLEGEVFKLPCKYTTLADKGWTISTTGVSSDTKIPGNSYESLSMVKDGKRIDVEIFNATGNAMAVKDCKVGGITADKKVEFSVAKGITINSTVAEIEAAFGIPSDRYSGDNNERLTYNHDSQNYNVWSKFVVYSEDDYSYISLRNFVKSDDDTTETSSEVPEYLAEYKAPAALGTDAKSANINLDGKLYQLPAPVSEFTADGWKISSHSGAITAGGSGDITLEKNGTKLSVNVANYSEYQTTPENCAIYRLMSYEADKNPAALELPGGIKLGMSKADLEKALTSDFEKFEGSASTTYSYSEYKQRTVYISISVSNETGLVSNISLKNETWNY